MNEKDKMGSWIETASGDKFDYTKKGIDGIHIEDIAAALSKCCRFTGHCSRFYSVAEHSIYVSTVLPRELALAGLLHDASEAYLSDIASPVKQLLPEYKKLEEKIMGRIAVKFGLQKKFWKDPRIKEADWGLLKVEAEALLMSKGHNWHFPDITIPIPIWPVCYSSDAAEILFLQRYEELTSGQD